jgi:hypothetical protein
MQMKTLLIKFSLFLLIGCSGIACATGPETVSAVQLEKMVNQSERDQVSTWIYCGSNETHHFIQRQFRVFKFKQSHFIITKDQLDIPDEFRNERNRPCRRIFMSKNPNPPPVHVFVFQIREERE